MADLQVTGTGKAQDGDITALCGNWTPNNRVSKQDAIGHIEGGATRYYTAIGQATTLVRVVNGATGKYLRTDSDNTTRNNLLDLPDC